MAVRISVAPILYPKYEANIEKMVAQMMAVQAQRVTMEQEMMAPAVVMEMATATGMMTMVKGTGTDTMVMTMMMMTTMMMTMIDEYVG